MVAKRKGWGESIKPKPHGILHFAWGQTLSKASLRSWRHIGAEISDTKKRQGNPSHFPPALLTRTVIRALKLGVRDSLFRKGIRICVALYPAAMS